MYFSKWMEAQKEGIPAVNAVGQQQASDQSLVKGPNAYNQTLDNCLQIATKIAAKFGYVVPPKPIVVDIILNHRASQLWGGSGMVLKPSPGNLVVRQPDDDAPGPDFHVAFELRGKEFNYGPSNDSRCPITMRIPLRKAP